MDAERIKLIEEMVDKSFEGNNPKEIVKFLIVAFVDHMATFGYITDALNRTARSLEDMAKSLRPLMMDSELVRDDDEEEDEDEEEIPGEVKPDIDGQFEQ